MAGDILPVELVAHIPILCEKTGVPYMYVGTKETLGAGSLSKNPTTVFMLMRPSTGHDLRDQYVGLFKELVDLNPYMTLDK